MTKQEIRHLEIETLHFVEDLFQGKKDNGGTEYIQHLWNVAEAVSLEGKRRSDWYDGGETTLSMFYHKAYVVALLHDTLEDTDTPPEQLKFLGCDDEIIDAVVCITRKYNETYFEFIDRVKKNDLARVVKIKDLEHNMDIRRLSKFGDYELRRLKKYWYCWKYLKNEITKDECLTNIN